MVRLRHIIDEDRWPRYAVVSVIIQRLRLSAAINTTTKGIPLCHYIYYTDKRVQSTLVPALSPCTSTETCPILFLWALMCPLRRIFIKFIPWAKCTKQNKSWTKRCSTVRSSHISVAVGYYMCLQKKLHWLASLQPPPPLIPYHSTVVSRLMWFRQVET